MNTSTIILLLLLLACPLSMLLMHGRGHRGHGDRAVGLHAEKRPATLEELRKSRDDLNARIAELEESDLLIESVTYPEGVSVQPPMRGSSGPPTIESARKE